MNYVMGDFGKSVTEQMKENAISSWKNAKNVFSSAGQFVYNAGSMAVDAIKPSINRVATYHIKPVAKPVVKPAPKPVSTVKPLPVIAPIAPARKGISTDVLIGGVAVAALGAYLVMRD